ncbi:MAG TPA: ATP-binding protein [Thermoanaerobaculia bacterium]
MPIEQLRARLQEAEDILRAIKYGEVDALVVNERRGDRVYTLKKPDRTYRLMIEEMAQGAVTLTIDGIILYCNGGFARMLKSPIHLLEGSPLHSRVSPGSRDLVDALLRQDGPAQGEAELLACDGSRMPVYLSVNPLPLEDEPEPVLCMVVTDLTEQKRSEELRRAWAAAEATNAAKDQFLATLSHELRTPLTPVLAMLSSLESREQIPDALRDEIAMMRRNIELEARLIDDLLDLTRISRGKLELQRGDVDLRQVLEHAVQTSCGEEIAAGRLNVVADFAAGHRLWADAPRLTQVFWNLLNNAVKFTPEGGTISVRSWTDSTGWLAIEVADTGIGIDPDFLSRIFDAFDQGEPDVTRRFGGLGLGLAISKTIVEMHGGSLSARSDGMGRGSAFRVSLPLTPVPQGAVLPAGEPRGPEDGSDRRLCILLVEDHTDTAAAMAELLRELGHEIVVAGSVAEGLAKAAASQEDGGSGIDLVLSDLGLPDGSGLDLMRELSSRYGLKGVALSGYGMEEDLRRSREAGFERHLTKPINFQSLQAVLREIAQR